MKALSPILIVSAASLLTGFNNRPTQGPPIEKAVTSSLAFGNCSLTSGGRTFEYSIGNEICINGVIQKCICTPEVQPKENCLGEAKWVTKYANGAPIYCNGQTPTPPQPQQNLSPEELDPPLLSDPSKL